MKEQDENHPESDIRGKEREENHTSTRYTDEYNGVIDIDGENVELKGEPGGGNQTKTTIDGPVTGPVHTGQGNININYQLTALWLVIGVILVLLSVVIYIGYKNMNHSPTIHNIVSGTDTLDVGEMTTLRVIAYDQDNDTLEYVWKVGKGIISNQPYNNSITYTAPQTSGFDTIQVTVSDGRAADTEEIKLQIIGSGQ